MSSGKRRWRGSLTPEDRALWETVTRSVMPLRPPGKNSADDAVPNAGKPKNKTAPKTKPPHKATGPAPRVPHPAPSYQSPQPQPGFDRRTRQRIAKGSIAIDARIDLHGMTQRQAHTSLKSFVAGCQLRGDRHVLVITGKGAWQADAPTMHNYGERGVLRRVVPQWLTMPEFRVFVVSFEEAHAAHGGGGAFYLRLRKRDPRQPR